MKDITHSIRVAQKAAREAVRIVEEYSDLRRRWREGPRRKFVEKWADDQLTRLPTLSRAELIASLEQGLDALEDRMAVKDEE